MHKYLDKFQSQRQRTVLEDKPEARRKTHGKVNLEINKGAEMLSIGVNAVSAAKK